MQGGIFGGLNWLPFDPYTVPLIERFLPPQRPLWVDDQVISVVRYRKSISLLTDIEPILNSILLSLIPERGPISIDQFEEIGTEDNVSIAFAGITAPQIMKDFDKLQVSLEAFSHSAVVSIEFFPNWYAGAATKVHGEGGPGARPTVFNGEPANPPYHFTLPSAISCGPDSDDGVSVYILDTVPKQQTIAEVRNSKCSAGQPWQHNQIMQHLLPEKTSLMTWHRADLKDPHMKLVEREFDYLHNLGRRRPMLMRHLQKIPDHGLFIAGIVNSLAPGAKLHLIEVLDEYGIGTYLTILHGLKKLETLLGNDQNSKIVVNCSFVLALPPSETKVATNVPPGHKRLLNQLLDKHPIEQLAKGLEEMASHIKVNSDKEIIFLAAAGNDGHDTTISSPQRLLTRYPAGYSSYIGVGALQSDDTRAPYSNIADEQEGFLTFGGDIQSNLSANPNSGILGIYTADDVNGRPNLSGWVRWAGTSFSTAVLSGLMACLASTHGIQSAYQQLKNLPHGGSPNEQNVIVKQS